MGWTKSVSLTISPDLEANRISNTRNMNFVWLNQSERTRWSVLDLSFVRERAKLHVQPGKCLFNILMDVTRSAKSFCYKTFQVLSAVFRAFAPAVSVKNGEQTRICEKFFICQKLKWSNNKSLTLSCCSLLYYVCIMQTPKVAPPSVVSGNWGSARCNGCCMVCGYPPKLDLLPALLCGLSTRFVLSARLGLRNAGLASAKGSGYFWVSGPW